MKRFFKYLAMVLFAAYLAFAFTCLTKRPEGVVCQKVEVIIQDSEGSIISKDEVLKILKREKLNPEGIELEKISCDKIEKKLRDNPLCKECECYKNAVNDVIIKIAGRCPILHVFSNKAGEFFIDKEGFVIKKIDKPLYLPIATGNIDKKFAENELYHLALFITEDKFWNAQIEQIHVNSHKEIELTPRVGNHTIYLGNAGNADKKFESLKVFYKKGLNTIGWNKYSALNIEFDNRIICTKK